MSEVEGIRQIMVSRAGGLEILELCRTQLPPLEAGRIRVRVLAAGVAYADVMMRCGKYPGAPRFPFVPGFDVVGEVLESAHDVRGFDRGQRIVGLTRIGGYSEVADVPATRAAAVDQATDPAQAVALVLNYVTAWQMLHRVVGVAPGQTILVIRAGGGAVTAL